MSHDHRTIIDDAGRGEAQPPLDPSPRGPGRNGASTALAGPFPSALCARGPRHIAGMAQQKGLTRHKPEIGPREMIHCRCVTATPGKLKKIGSITRVHVCSPLYSAGGSALSLSLSRLDRQDGITCRREGGRGGQLALGRLCAFCACFLSVRWTIVRGSSEPATYYCTRIEQGTRVTAVRQVAAHTRTPFTWASSLVPEHDCAGASASPKALGPLSPSRSPVPPYPSFRLGRPFLPCRGGRGHSPPPWWGPLPPERVCPAFSRRKREGGALPHHRLSATARAVRRHLLHVSGADSGGGGGS